MVMKNIAFEDLENGFNFYTGAHRAQDFLSIIKNVVKSEDTVLDVGCGRGICRSIEGQKEVGAQCGTFWGVEPDPTVEIDSELFQKVWRSNLEDADIPSNSLDVVYSAMVLEHVAKPEEFLGKVYDILKPGGTFLAVTISGMSYLGVSTLLSEKLKIQDSLLKVLVGSKNVEEYHYPALYRMNRESSLKKASESVGFSRVRFAYTDNHDALVYFPKGTAWMGRALDCMKKTVKRRQLLNNMYIAIEK